MTIIFIQNILTNCKNYETYNFYTKPVKFIVRKNRINLFDSIKQNNLLQHWKFNAIEIKTTIDKRVYRFVNI